MRPEASATSTRTGDFGPTGATAGFRQDVRPARQTTPPCTSGAPQSTRKYPYFCIRGGCKTQHGGGGRSAFLRHYKGHEDRFFCLLCLQPEDVLEQLTCQCKHASSDWLVNFEIHQIVCGRAAVPYRTREQGVKEHMEKQHASTRGRAPRYECLRPR